MRRLFNLIKYNGTKKAISPEEASKIVYLNVCLLVTFLVFIFNTAYEVYLKLPYTVAIDILFNITIFAIFFINGSGRYKLARNITIIAANVLILLGTIAEGTAAGNQIIYLPLFFITAALGNVKDNTREIVFLLLFTIICFTVSSFFLPKYSVVQTIGESVVEAMYAGNQIIAMVSCVVIAILVVVITRRNEAELETAKLEAEENAQSKMQFLGNMSHELRTPLNGIIGTTNLMLSETHNSLQGEHLQLLKYSSNHMLQLVNQVLDYSKIESGKIELQPHEFNLQAFLKNLKNIFSYQFQEKGISLELITKGNTTRNIFADDVKLSQVLNNLLANALKFTEVGKVVIECEVLQESTEKLQLKFSIQDSGIGIPKEKQATIFEEFEQAEGGNTTRRYGGTGLGLSISKKLVGAMGGELNIQSQVGVGSVFSFLLNVERASFNESNRVSEIKVKVNPDEIRQLTNKTILVAEDNKVNLLIAKKFLNAWGATILEANNGKQAIEIAKANNSIDLLLLDLEMPEADGYAALKQIKLFKPNVPAIAFTAAYFTDIEAKLKNHGFNDYILKPFVPADLNNKIATLLQ
jgi:signal transduction histidine kinase/CheY-like chemotaxis protein